MKGQILHRGTLTPRQAGADGAAARARDLGLRLQSRAEDAGLRGLLEGGRRGRRTPSRSTAPTDGHFQFKYLPAFAVLAIPIGRSCRSRPPRSSGSAVSVAAPRRARRAEPSTSLPERRKPLALARASSRSSSLPKFYAHELVLGQVNILFAVVAVRRAAGDEDAAARLRAGLLVALAIVVKPYAVLFLPWLVARRRAAVDRWPRCAGLAGSCSSLPALLYGVGRQHRAAP